MPKKSLTVKSILKNIRILPLKKKKNKPDKRAFTLIEILVVATLISIVSGVTLTVLNPATFRDRANDALTIRAFKSIVVALVAYYELHGHFPETPVTCDAGNTASCKMLSIVEGAVFDASDTYDLSDDSFTLWFHIPGVPTSYISTDTGKEIFVYEDFNTEFGNGMKGCLATALPSSKGDNGAAGKKYLVWSHHGSGIKVCTRPGPGNDNFPCNLYQNPLKNSVCAPLN